MTADRLPIFILIDTSGSMAGGPAEILARDLGRLQGVMRVDALIRERADVCHIGFGNEARLIRSHAPLDSFDSLRNCTPPERRRPGRSWSSC